MPSHYTQNLDPKMQRLVDQLLQGQQSAAPAPLQRRGAQYPVINALARVLPGFKSKKQKARRQIPGLEQLLEGSEDKDVLRQLGIAGALKDTAPAQARDILLQAAQPKQQGQLPPGVLEILTKANLGEKGLENVTQVEHGFKPGESDAVKMYKHINSIPDPEERKNALNLWNRIGGVNDPDATIRINREKEQAKADNRAHTDTETKLAYLSKFPASEQEKIRRVLFGAGGRTESDLIYELPQYGATKHQRSLEKLEAQYGKDPTSAFQSAMVPGAAKQVLSARASLNGGFGDLVKANVDHLNKVLNDDYFDTYYGAYNFTNEGRRLRSEKARDFYAGIDKIAGEQMMKAIAEFTGAVSDADLVQAARAATALFESSSVSPKEARDALTHLRDAYKKALERKKAEASVQNMAQYEALSQSNTIPTNWKVEK